MKDHLDFKNEDIELTFENCPDIKHLNISISTSDIMINGKFGGRKTWKDVLNSMVEALKVAKKPGQRPLALMQRTPRGQILISS